MTMKPDYIPTTLWRGDAAVRCQTCGAEADFNPLAKTYECDCRFGATVEALAMGVRGYAWYGE